MFNIILVEDWCTGEQYQVILGKCFYFEYTKMIFSSAKQNCLSLTKEGRSGKLAEPTTLQILTKLVEAAKYTFGYGRGQSVHIGVEKIDNNGNMKYTSTGLKTPISPWKEGGNVRNGMDRPYLCVYPNWGGLDFSGGAIWQDCADSYTDHNFSVCEF